MTNSTADRAVEQTEARRRRRKVCIALGTLGVVGALVTAAAFTDIARLNIGADGVGGADSTYNIQVGATDAEGRFTAGWQEADGDAGVSIALDGAESVFPGSDPIGVTIPVRNDSAHFASSLELSLEQRPDDADAGIVTDADYLSSLRFSVGMPATSRDSSPVSASNLTYAQLQDLTLNDLAPEETSTVRIAMRLLSQADSGAGFTDNSLSGKGAFVQAVFNGTSL